MMQTDRPETSSNRRRPPDLISSEHLLGRATTAVSVEIEVRPDEKVT